MHFRMFLGGLLSVSDCFACAKTVKLLEIICIFAFKLISPESSHFGLSTFALLMLKHSFFPKCVGSVLFPLAASTLF